MALSECLDSRSGSIGVAATRGKSYSRYFLRLLRLGRIDSRHDKANQHKNSFHAPIFTAVRDALSRKFGPERQILDQKRGDTFKKL